MAGDAKAFEIEEQGDDLIAAFSVVQFFCDDLVDHLLELLYEVVIERFGNTLLAAEMIVNGTDAHVSFLLHVMHGDIVITMLHEQI